MQRTTSSNNGLQQPALCVAQPSFEPGPRAAPLSAERAPRSWSHLSPISRRYLMLLAFFTLGKVPEAFPLLRGHELGMSVVELLLL